MTAEEKIIAIQALIDRRFDDIQLCKIGTLWSGPNYFELNVHEIINHN